MRHIRIENIITMPKPVERPGENAAIWSIVALNLVAALVLFVARFL